MSTVVDGLRGGTFSGSVYEDGGRDCSNKCRRMKNANKGRVTRAGASDGEEGRTYRLKR